MKIGEPLPINDDVITNKRNERWARVLEHVLKLPDGYALPVEVDDTKEAQCLQYFVFQKLNRKPGSKRYGASRRGNTVYIYQAKT